MTRLRKTTTPKTKAGRTLPAPSTKAPARPRQSDLFDRVVRILEEARGRAARAIHSEMVLSYWHIGREIVGHLQGGDERAEYGKRAIDALSKRLTRRYGRGFSTTNLRYFRTFYLLYSRREPEIRHITSGELTGPRKRRGQADVTQDLQRAVDGENTSRGFSPQLSWSHYRALIKVEHASERLFYEIEAEKQG